MTKAPDLYDIANELQGVTQALMSIQELIGDKRDTHLINSANLYYLLDTVISRQEKLVGNLMTLK